MLSSDAPLVLLQHHGLDNLGGKTGLAMLRYRRGPIVAVIDPDHAGADVELVTGIRRSVPVVASMREALPLLPPGVLACSSVCGKSGAVAVVGLAPSGGRLPTELHADLVMGLEAGLSVASGLHSRLGEDPLLVAKLQPGRWIWDLRREPEDLVVGSARAASLAGSRLLAVGTDMSVGKMSACLELQAVACRRGLDARFVGTGQAGILISGSGVALDAVRVDYAAGAVEQAVLAAGAGATNKTLVLVEGQGSLCHPGSTATLPLIRGCQPTHLVLVHRAGQTTIRSAPHVPIPPLSELIAVVQGLAALARPHPTAPAPKVAAIALNTAHLGDEEAQDALETVREQTGLPCHDPVRHGGDGLLDALMLAGVPGPSTMVDGRASEGIRTPE
ncbi:MAG: DUF1611 domain-containing protein [Cyanobacteriota bacterium]|jgi:uncharacterized NAD-dependent epimerase/dehydratase family protein